MEGIRLTYDMIMCPMVEYLHLPAETASSNWRYPRQCSGQSGDDDDLDYGKNRDGENTWVQDILVAEDQCYLQNKVIIRWRQCWRESSVGKVFAFLARGPEFNPQKSFKKTGLVACTHMRGEALAEALSREARKVNGKKIKFFTIVTEAITDLLFGHLASLQVHNRLSSSCSF